MIFPDQDEAIWRWDLINNPFGETAPNTDPDGDSTQFVFNLRFPGQIYDAESGLNYNFFRDYEPSTGRYIESDPIGLIGGIATFAYVSSAPLRLTDRRGLDDAATDALVNHYLGGNGEYMDISEYCGSYLADPRISPIQTRLKERARNMAKSLADADFNGTYDWSYSEQNSAYITSIKGFGAGLLHFAAVNCRFTGSGCCVSGDCKTGYGARDLFTDPFDLNEAFGLGHAIGDFAGTPFWFGLSCSGKPFKVHECKTF